MKTLSNLIQGTKDILNKGKDKVRRGAITSLAALAVGCAVVPPTPEIIVCSYNEDSDNNGLSYPNDYKKIGNNFKRNERVTVNYTKPKPNSRTTAKIYNENKEEIVETTVVADKEDQIAYFTWAEYSFDAGVYEVRIFSDNIQVQTTYFTIQH